MKFLTLISGKTVKLAPGVKRIPENEFSELIETKALQDLIKKEGDELKKKIQEDGEIFFENAKKKGFNEGLNKWSEQIKHLEHCADHAKNDLQKFLVQIVMATAKKVVGRELSQNSNTIADIVMKNLRAVSSHRKITIYANKNDLIHLETQREELKKGFDKIDSFHIEARDDIHAGGVIIETEAGIIDARAEKLWDTLEKALDELIHKKK
ncbi:MAG: hypothetical protein S4CHLAM7_08380 [Chlamydiae bacterium]|nr:hypothetical protein [Chlamydiota bacterium]